MTRDTIRLGTATEDLHSGIGHPPSFPGACMHTNVPVSASIDKCHEQSSMSVPLTTSLPYGAFSESPRTRFCEGKAAQDISCLNNSPPICLCGTIGHVSKLMCLLHPGRKGATHYSTTFHTQAICSLCAQQGPPLRWRAHHPSPFPRLAEAGKDQPRCCSPSSGRGLFPQPRAQLVTLPVCSAPVWL